MVTLPAATAQADLHVGQADGFAAIAVIQAFPPNEYYRPGAACESEWKQTLNAQGKGRRSTAGAEGTNKGHENAEGMALVGVRLTDQLGNSALSNPE